MGKRGNGVNVAPAAIVIFLLGCSAVHAQTGRIEGRIVDAESGEPVAGANVVVQGTRLGDVSDALGRYEIRNVPPGTYGLQFLHIGYDTLTVSAVQVLASRTIVRNVTLQPSVMMMEGVTVEAIRESPERYRNLVSVREMTPRSAKRMAGAAEDLFRALQVLPGVLAQSEFDTRLYVRGGRPDQNLTLVDGISVYDPYRLFGLVTMFNPETVSEVRLIPGGFPARYRDRLSAVLEVTNRSGNQEAPFSANLNTSITNANLVLEGKLPGTQRGAWIFSSRRTYYDLIAARFTDVGTFPNFWDIQAKLDVRLSHRDKLQIEWVNSREGTNLVTSQEDFENEEDNYDIDSLRVLDAQRQRILGISYDRVYSPSFFSRTIVSHYRNSSRTDFDATFTRARFLFSALLDLRTEELGIKHEITWQPLARHRIEAGAQWSRLRASNIWQFDTDFPGVILSDVVRFTRDAPTTFKTGAYVQDTFAASDHWTLEAGLRLDHSTMVSRSTVSPRLSARWAVGPLTELRFAWGLYYQNPSYETLQGEGFRYDLQQVKRLGIRPERAVHYLVGLRQRLSDTWTFHLEGYYKRLTDLLVPARADTTWLIVADRLGGNVRTEYHPTEYFTWEPRNAANGHASGLELYLERRPHKGQRFAGWASYAIAVVRAREDQRPPIYLPYDQRHTVNIVGEVRLSKSWNVEFKWQYGSGFPYTEIEHVVEVVGDQNGNGRLDVYEDRNNNGRLDPWEDRNGNGVLDTVDPVTGAADERTALVPDDLRNRELGARYPAHHRLDLRLSHSRSFWKADWLFYLDVINVYNRKNVQVYDYNNDFSEKKPIYGIPLVPTLGFSVRF